MDITLNPTAHAGITIGPPAQDLTPEQVLERVIAQGRYAHNLRIRMASLRVRGMIASRGVASVQVQAEGKQIGRASCRERVLRAVVGRVIKKKSVLRSMRDEQR